MISYTCLALGSFIFGYVIGRMMLVSYSFKNMYTWVDAITKNDDAFDTHIKYISEIRMNRVRLEELKQEIEEHLNDNIKK